MGVRARIAVAECIQQYEISAKTHYEKGFDELANGDAFGMNLMGLAAEMTLNAAFFRLIGYPHSHEISHSDRNEAKSDVVSLGIAAPWNMHDVIFWSEAIPSVRAHGIIAKTRNSGVATPSVAPNPLPAQDMADLQSFAKRLATNWDIEDRYIGIQSFATQDDMDEVFEDVTGIIKI